MVGCLRLKKKDINIYINDEYPNCPIKCIGIIKSSLDSIIHVITNLNLKNMKKWNKSIIELSVVEKLSEELDIIYIAKKFSFLTRKLDHVLLRLNKILKDGSFISVYCSTRHSKCPRKRGYYRSIIKANGFYIKTTEDPNVNLVCYMQEIKYGVKEFNNIMKQTLIKDSYKQFNLLRNTVLNLDKNLIDFEFTPHKEEKKVLKRSNSDKNIEIEKPDRRNRSQTITTKKTEKI